MVQTAKNFSVIGFIKLTRIGNLLIIVLAQYLAAIFLIFESSNWREVITNPYLFLLSLSSVLIAAAGYIINDYYDVKIDYINKPEKVIVGRVIKRRVVMVAHTIINLAGISIGFLVSPLIAIINFSSAMLLWLYSNQLKRLRFVGNLAVGLLSGLSIYVVDLYFGTNSRLIIIYSLFAVGYTIIREIVKDMEDVKGDKAFDCRTLPVVYGLKKTKLILYFFMVLLASILTFVLVPLLSTSAWPLLIGNIVMLLIQVILLYRGDTKRDFHNLSTAIKLMMLIGVLSMIFI